MGHRKLKILTAFACCLGGTGLVLAFGLSDPTLMPALPTIGAGPAAGTKVPGVDAQAPAPTLAGPAAAASPDDADDPPCVDRTLIPASPSAADIGAGLPECARGLELGSFANAALWAAPELGRFGSGTGIAAGPRSAAGESGFGRGGSGGFRLGGAAAGGGGGGGSGGDRDATATPVAPSLTLAVPGGSTPGAPGTFGDAASPPVAVTPLPAGAWLLLAGLGALVGARYRASAGASGNA